MITDEPERTTSAAFSWTDYDSVSSAVVTAVSEVSGDDPLNLTRLHDVIDPDALNKIFTRTGSSRAVSNGSVEFDYENYRVVIKENGRGYIYESR